MSITIKDIAKIANTSVSTVSKALNDKTDISESLKSKIKCIANEMGYKKNVIASRLASRRSNTIGVFFLSRFTVKRESESAANKYINTMLDEIRNKGYDLTIFSINNCLPTDKSYIELCQERQVEGAIFIGFQDIDPHIEDIKNSDIPIIMIESSLCGNNINSITFNNRSGIMQALNYLTSLNHKKIGFITGESNSEVAKERFSTYKEFMIKNNLFNPQMVFRGDYTFSDGYKLGNLISKYKNLPTAIISSNDLMAVGLIRSFKENNIDIPNKISVIGYDDFEICKYISPSLTTVSQDFSLAAKYAIKTLLNVIEEETKNINIILEPKLIIRESCTSPLPNV